MTSKAFERHILSWYRRHGRHGLPWRKTRDRYRILISEVMLQQTQVSRVLPYYRRFIKHFSNVRALAAASLAEVIGVWSGLGYNRRAKYLWEAAQVMVKNYRGKVPLDAAVLETLPGIGQYTARAIICFAGNACEPFIETNIRRVLLHFFFPYARNVSDQRLLNLLSSLQPLRRTGPVTLRTPIVCSPRASIHRGPGSGATRSAEILRHWYLALMDYGACALTRLPNPNRRSRHHTKQSVFVGSDRYYRGAVLRFLIAEPRGLLFRDIMTRITPRVAEARLQSILQQLAKENIITCPHPLTLRSRCGIVSAR